MALLAILQATILPHLPLFGVAPQLWLLVSVAMALLFGLQAGLVWAFFAGLFIDLWSVAPLGVTSLALMASVALVVAIQRLFPHSRIILPLALTALATAVFWAVELLLLRLLMPLVIGGAEFLPWEQLLTGSRASAILSDIGRGYGLSQSTARVAILTIFANCLLILPIYWAMGTLARQFNRQRVEI
jgi:rod shape-determining protein MreD